MGGQAYEVLNGLSYPSPLCPDGERYVPVWDPPAVVDDLPAQSVGWLLAEGLIRPTDRAVTPLDYAPAPADPVTLEVPAVPDAAPAEVVESAAEPATEVAPEPETVSAPVVAPETDAPAEVPPDA